MRRGGGDAEGVIRGGFMGNLKGRGGGSMVSTMSQTGEDVLFRGQRHDAAASIDLIMRQTRKDAHVIWTRVAFRRSSGVSTSLLLVSLLHDLKKSREHSPESF